MKIIIMLSVLMTSGILFAREKGWEVAQFGMYSGKPGYFIKIGKDSELQMESIVMNEDVAETLGKAFAKASLGGMASCSVKGMQQTAGYTVFKIKNCKYQ